MDDMVDRPDSCIIYRKGVEGEDDSNANGRPEALSSILRGVGGSESPDIKRPKIRVLEPPAKPPGLNGLSVGRPVKGHLSTP